MEFVLDEKLVLLITKASFELYHVLMLRTLRKNNYFSGCKKESVAGQKTANAATVPVMRNASMTGSDNANRQMGCDKSARRGEVLGKALSRVKRSASGYCNCR
jgi:uncharacterized protein YaiE (UPF0345 family)